MAGSGCEEEYVPPHTFSELKSVQAWAVGQAFASFSDEAQVFFDQDRYHADSPNMGLFGFGLHTGTRCLELDVVSLYVPMQVVLSRKWHQVDEDPEAFKEIYLEMIKESGFEDYLASEDLIPLVSIN